MPKKEELHPEVQGLYDSIHATVRICRWFYECGLKEGFTPNQALELSKSYIIALFGGMKK